MPDEAIAIVAAPTSSSLEYQPVRSYQTRWTRLTIIVIAGLVIAALMPRMWTEFGYRVGRRAVQNEFITFSVAPGTLAYEEVGIPRWLSGVSAAPRTPLDIKAMQAPSWQAQWDMPRYFPGQEATLFLHDRTSTGGNRRIVGVSMLFEFNHAYDGVERQPLVLRVASADIITFMSSSSLDPRVWSDTIYVGYWPNGANVRTKFYAAQIDPNDPSRFTITYAFGDETGTIQGSLRDDGTVSLSAVDGPLATNR
jgi:hypothetical protein